MSTRRLTTTSYAILGLLAIRDWSAYDLTGYMRTSAVRACWPRTESRLYQEPKNLVAHGLARASTERTGDRRRTVYSITGEGRKALRSWHDEAVEPRQIQDEMLLRLFLGDEATVPQLRAAIRSEIANLGAQVGRIMEFAPRVAEGESIFPERLHFSALAARHQIGLVRARVDYLRWADEWLAGWDDTALDEGKKERAIAELGDALGALRDIAEVLDELAEGCGESVR